MQTILIVALFASVMMFVLFFVVAGINPVQHRSTR